jgi:hypothetical protein
MKTRRGSGSLHSLWYQHAGEISQAVNFPAWQSCQQDLKTGNSQMVKSTKALKIVPAKVVPAAADDVNYFSEYARVAGSTTTIIGMLLKFSKGDFVAGQDNESLDIGTKLIANMEALLVGWQRWEDARPVEQNMGPVMEGFMPPRREELGFTDQSEWETDEATGKARDPWVYSHLLLMKEPGKRGQLYTFTTNSAGGKNAMAKLCGEYGKLMREHTDEYPVVKLEVGSYLHSNPAYGRIKFPIFEIVGWADKSEFDEAADAPVATPARKKIK